MRRSPARLLGVASIATLGFLPAAAATADEAVAKPQQSRAALSAKYEGGAKAKTRARAKSRVKARAAATSFTMTPSYGPRGTRVTVKGSEFQKSYAGWVKFRGVRVANVKTDSYGRFTTSFVVPTSAPLGSATVLASVGSRQASKSFSVTSTSTATPTPAPSATPAPTATPAPSATPAPTATPAPITGTNTPIDMKTGFESRNGSSWTSLSEEQSFLRDLDAASGRVAVSEIGRSVQNRPIQLVTVGVPRTKAEIAAGSSVLFICTQHGTEPAGREACLQGARDYANTTDGSTVLIVPTANPDGFAVTSRHNANGVDINRDHAKLATPEARILASVMREYKPDLIGDLHEYQTSGASAVLLGKPLHLNVDPQIRQLSSTLNDSYAVTAIRGAGFGTGVYGGTDSHADENILRHQAALRHTPSLLVETPRLGSLSPLARVRAHRTAVGAMMKMLSERTFELASATAAAADRAAAEGAAGNQRYYYASPSTYSDAPSCGYKLTDSQYQSAQRTLGLHGILATPASGAWNISTAQAAQPMIGVLLDSRAPGELTAGQRLSC